VSSHRAVLQGRGRHGRQQQLARVQRLDVLLQVLATAALTFRRQTHQHLAVSQQVEARLLQGSRCTVSVAATTVQDQARVKCQTAQYHHSSGSSGMGHGRSETRQSKAAGTLGAHQLAGAQEALQLGGVVQGAHHRPLHVRVVELRRQGAWNSQGAHVMKHNISGPALQ
jgi:hypothetical protein